MKTATKMWRVLLLCVLVGIFFVIVLKNKDSYLAFFREKYEKEVPPESRQEQEIVLPKLKPHEGERQILIHPVTSLNGMTMDEITAFRILRVQEHALLNIFPPGYDPRRPPHDEIYSSITSRADWLSPAQFYINHPYLFIILSCAGTVHPVAEDCGYIELKYSKGVMEEIYRGSEAEKWFEKLTYCSGDLLEMHVWMVNAYDAGLFYANVDMTRSQNLDPYYNDTPVSIVNSVYSNHGIFHVGRYGVNNLSPEDKNAWIKLREPKVFTQVFVKLWREKPESKEQQEELAYIIKVMP